MERLHVDLTGPHPRSRRGSVYIVTCIDPFTKWCEAFPAPNKEAATVARIIVEQVICRLGAPIAILSDQGKEVDGLLMAEVCKLLEIDKQRTTAYKPSTNAAIERFHRTLNSMIGRVIEENHRDWDSLLPYVMAAYRSSRHESTQYSPNFLMMGREVRSPADLIYGSPVDGLPLTYDDYAEELQQRMRTAYSLVRGHLRVAAERTKRYYDLRVRPQAYHVGDFVYYYNPRRMAGRQEKWCRKFSGPYLVVKIMGPVNVMLQRSKRAKTFIAHIDKLKPYDGDDVPESWVSLGDDEETIVKVPVDIGQHADAQLNEMCEDPLMMISDGADDDAAPVDVLLDHENVCETEPVETPLLATETEEPPAAIAGAPPVSYRSPRPKRRAGRPRRYADRILAL